jgi:hypothetical protein
VRRALLTMAALAALPAPAVGLDGTPTRALRDDSAPRSELVPVRLEEARGRELRVPFHARGDRTLVGARVQLVIDPAVRPALPRLDVLVNGRVVGSVPPGAEEPRMFEVSGDDLGDRNELVLRLSPAGGGDPCAPPAVGAWRALRSASLEVLSVPAALPADLGLLPLPFVDPEVDREAELAVVLTGSGSGAIRAAALVAGWFGLMGGVPLRFRVLQGELPPGDAVVLLDGPPAAARLGLPAPHAPRVRVVESPRSPGKHLLVVEAGDEAGLLQAAQRLAQGGVTLAGPSMALDPRPPPPPALPYDAPRWRPSGRPLRLGDVADPGALAKADVGDGTVEVRFRVAPDLWTWPDDTVLLDLGYAQRVPTGGRPPRLDLHLNGEFLATLPKLPAPSTPGEEVVGRASIPIPAERLRGFDLLALYVRYPRGRSACAAAPTDPAVRLTPDSTLHLERYGHFAVLPDLSRLLYDGFPFTRVADLGETVAVLPDPPPPDAIAALLSLVAHFATITGRAGTRLIVTTSAHVAEVAKGRDLLAIGLAEPDPLLSAVRGELPLRADQGGGRAVGSPPDASALLDLLAGAPGRRESRRARAVVATLGAFSALQQVASPFDQGRSAVFLTAFGGAEVPSLPALLGDAESRTPAGDLLILSGERRWMFRLGPSFGSGRIGPLAHLRWFLHEHWLLLVPGFAFGALLIALPMQRGLAARARQRLAAERGA